MLVSNDLLAYLENEKNLSEFCELIEDKYFENITVLNKKTKDFLSHKQKLQLNWAELEKFKAISEKKGKDDDKLFEQILSSEKIDEPRKKTSAEYNVKVVFSYEGAPKKREANNFIQYFNNRYQSIEKILKQNRTLTENR